MNKRLIMAGIFLSMMFYNLTVYGKETVLNENIVTNQTKVHWKRSRRLRMSGEDIITDQTGEFQYSINSDGTATIRAYLGEREGIEIPQSLDEIAVTAIGDRAFSVFEYMKNYLKTKGNPDEDIEFGFFHEVFIPEGIMTIGKEAFWV